MQIIYSARGSNQNWEWLSFITLCIYVLRKLISNVHEEFKTPYNGTSHTSPDTRKDIDRLLSYMIDKKLQTYWPGRPRNDAATPVRDLAAENAVYSSTTGAFNTFCSKTLGATYSKPKKPVRRDAGASPRAAVDEVGSGNADPPSPYTGATDTPDNHDAFSQARMDVDDDDSESDDDEDAEPAHMSSPDMPEDQELTIDDLSLDNEEWPPGIDKHAVIDGVRHMIRDISFD